MSKRHLTRRQAWRVDKIQQLRLERSAKKADQLGDLRTEIPGLVIARYGATVDVQAQDKTVYHCFQRQNLGDLVAGDTVLFSPADNQKGVVTALQPRQTVLARPTLHAASKPLAANIDCMAIVIAPEPKPSSQLLDSYIVAAELLGITPIIVLNKIDLEQQQDIDPAIYQQLGYSIIPVSARADKGLDKLLDTLKDHNSIFVGQSGVGKSSLISSILPKESIRVGPLSERSKLGKHTTTAAKLYHLPQGGRLIDSPGVRNFKLWQTAPSTLLEGFKELQPLAGQCKFRDCSHRHEPGCAIQDALLSGKIHPSRLASYHYLVDFINKK